MKLCLNVQIRRSYDAQKKKTCYHYRNPVL